MRVSQRGFWQWETQELMSYKRFVNYYGLWPEDWLKSIYPRITGTQSDAIYPTGMSEALHYTVSTTTKDVRLCLVEKDVDNYGHTSPFNISV